MKSLKSLKYLYLKVLLFEYLSNQKKPMTLKQYRCLVSTPVKFIHKYLEKGNLL